MGDRVQGKWLRHSHTQREWGKKCCQAKGERASPAAQASCTPLRQKSIHEGGWTCSLRRRFSKNLQEMRTMHSECVCGGAVASVRGVLT